MIRRVVEQTARNAGKLDVVVRSEIELSSFQVVGQRLDHKIERADFALFFRYRKQHYLRQWLLAKVAVVELTTRAVQ